MMERIKSFEVDHTKIDVGMYISRIDGDITTYDVRMVKPNGARYLSADGIHTIEHLFATYARNTPWKDHIVYVGPMGCLTGFYFLTRDLAHETAIEIVRQAMQFVQNYEGEIPGASEIECGNYRLHSLEHAKKDVQAICKVLQEYAVERLQYRT